MSALAENPKARYDYEILETLTAGLVLSGPEVKSIRSGKCSIKGCFVKILHGEAYLMGATIAPYQPGNMPKNYDDQRSRKLLLKKSELKYLIGKSEERGLALIPLKIIDHHGLLKIELGIGRGKKKHDKRAVIAKRETERKIRQALKG